MINQVGNFVGTALVWGTIVAIFFWLIRNIWMAYKTKEASRSRYVIWSLITLVLIETASLLVARDVCSGLYLSNQDLASTTAAFVADNQEYDRLNKSGFAENKRLNEENTKLWEANENLAGQLKKYCPQCVVKEQ